MKEILLPTDFSSSSDLAAEVAAAMAMEAGARLHVVHVVPPVTDPSLGSEQLTRFGRLLGKRLNLEISLLSGRAAREITTYAREKGIDVIVMSTHGRSGWSRALLGSVTEAVVRMAPCFVLTVPAARTRGDVGRSEEVRVPAASFVHRCIVCATDSGDLVCEKCRQRIRDEALEHKVQAERAARRAPTE